MLKDHDCLMRMLLDSADTPLETGLYNIQMGRLSRRRLGITGPCSPNQHAISECNDQIQHMRRRLHIDIMLSHLVSVPEQILNEYNKLLASLHIKRVNKFLIQSEIYE